MTIQAALRKGEKDFIAAGCESPGLDALVLMAANLGRDKAFLFSHRDDELTIMEEAAFEKMRSQRAGGLPVAYITKTKEFYGLPFYVDERVLVPRPETEILVDTALEIIRGETRALRIHDVCTGSGCVAIAIAQAISGGGGPGAEVSASDISSAAMEVFRLNCRTLLGRVLPHHSADLLSGTQPGLDMITANPPYVSSADFRNMRGWPEPRLALDGGEDGLDVIRALAAQAPGYLREGGWLLMEASPPQMDCIRGVLEINRWRDIRIVRDLAGRERVVAARMP